MLETCDGYRDKTCDALCSCPHTATYEGETAMSKRFGLRKVRYCVAHYPPIADKFSEIFDEIWETVPEKDIELTGDNYKDCGRALSASYRHSMYVAMLTYSDPRYVVFGHMNPSNYTAKEVA